EETHMGKIRIATLEDAPSAAPRDGAEGEVKTRAILADASDPLHARLHQLARNAVLSLGPLETDCVVYVWRGAVEAGGRRLAAGSSLVVEHSASIDIRGCEAASDLVAFNAARPSGDGLAGGHVHSLPAEHVPRAELAGTQGAAGALHADAACPSCR